ncbi:MAG: FCD domain-containing protein, partial [Bacteroidota bacterium]
ITPDIVNSFITYKVCNDVTEFKALREHQRILGFIRDGDALAAEAAMQSHLSDVMDFSRKHFTH